MAKARSSIGSILHSAAARYRVRGNGMLRTRLLNMGRITSDEISLKYVDLDEINMNFRSNQDRTILANFQDQGIQLQFRVIHIDEVLNISKIIIFNKPVAEGYPIKTGAL